VVAQFKISDGEKTPFDGIMKNVVGANCGHAVGTNCGHAVGTNCNLSLLAWTTTPWTLPSNTALTVGPNIEYTLVSTFNQYTFEPINVILAKNLVGYQFSKGYQAVENETDLANYTAGDKSIPYFVAGTCLGKDLVGIKYEQLLPYCLPDENPEKAFVVNGKKMEAGTLIVLKTSNTGNWASATKQVCDQFQLEAISVNSGWVESGADFGSPSDKIINQLVRI
jgi:isoleucyl-tRNA synthetase